jgi:serine/threonine-protein kinase
MSDAIIGTEVDGYRIQAVLGRGGMGTVYRAEDVNLSRTVAIKRINPDQQERDSFIHRFRSEAQALARIDSPHIVGIYALRETDVGLLIVMEYVKGGTLKAPLRDQGPIAREQAFPILEQILQAFHDAHSAGVIHRDIKPQNIMLTQDGVVKVTDFGIAKLRRPDSGETVTQGGQGGTLKYMSPEQISNISAVDTRSDLYSIGMTAYEMLTGTLPFKEADTDFDIMRKVVEGEIPPPDERNADVPSGLAQWVVGAIQNEQADRYQSAEEMLNALREVDEQVGATRTQPSWEVDGGGTDADGTQTILPDAEQSRPEGPAPGVDTERAPEPTADPAPDLDAPRDDAPTPPATASPSADTEAPPDTKEATDVENGGASPSEEEGAGWGAVVGGAVLVLLLAGGGIYTLTQAGDPAAPATLSLTTTPTGATVLVNGDTAGTTPLGGYALEAGAVQLQVKKEGHRPVDSSFTVETGDEVALPDLSLAARAPATTDDAGPTADARTTPPDAEAEDAAASSDPADPEASSSTASTGPEPSDTAPAPATGTVAVTPQPVGTVLVDGAARSGTSVELPVGAHSVTCRHPQGGATQTTVTVTAGQTTRLTCYTEVTVNVTTDGPFGRIWLNGQDTRKNTNAGGTLSLPPGTHRIEVRRRSIEGFRVEGGTAKIERGEQSRIDEFAGPSYRLQVEPTFERVEHAVVFSVEGV